MRIRSIRPEFWSSTDIADLDWHARLVFIGLWSYVDDNGVGRDVEKLIVSALFPLDETLTEPSVRVHGALKQLETGGQVTRYMVGCKHYIHITAFNTHQVINRASKDRYPLPTCDDAKTHGALSEPSVSPHANDALGEGEKGRRGEGEKVTTLSVATAPNEFDIFYDLYPKKVNPKAARAKWLTVIKNTEPCVILAGIRAQLPQMATTDRQYIPAPDVWLNKGKWADEVAPAAPARTEGWWNNQ